MRIEWIDALKGVGMLMIILSHISPFSYNWIIFVGFIPIFFIASGMTLHFSSSFKKDLIKRAKRLLIPYFCYSLFALVVDYLLGYITDNRDWYIRIVGVLYGRFCLFPWKSYQNVDFLYGNGPLWFLPSIFVAFVFAYLLKKYDKRYCGYLIFGLATIVFSFSPILLPWSIDTVFLSSIYICIGGGMYNYLSKKKFYYIYDLILLLFFMTLSFINGYSNYSVRIYGDLGIPSIFLFFILGVLETYLISVFCMKIEKYKKAIAPLSYIGRNSLRLMCIHYPIYLVVKFFLFQYGGKFVVAPCSLLAIFICLHLWSGFLNTRFARKYSLNNYL